LIDCAMPPCHHSHSRQEDINRSGLFVKNIRAIDSISRAYAGYDLPEMCVSTHSEMTLKHIDIGMTPTLPQRLICISAPFILVLRCENQNAPSLCRSKLPVHLCRRPLRHPISSRICRRFTHHLLYHLGHSSPARHLTCRQYGSRSDPRMGHRAIHLGVKVVTFFQQGLATSAPCRAAALKRELIPRYRTDSNKNRICKSFCRVYCANLT